LLDGPRVDFFEIAEEEEEEDFRRGFADFEGFVEEEEVNVFFFFALATVFFRFGPLLFLLFSS